MSVPAIEHLLARAHQALLSGNLEELEVLNSALEAALPSLELPEPAERLERLQQNAAMARDLALAALQGLETARTRRNLSAFSTVYVQGGQRQTLGPAPAAGHRRV